MKRPTGKASVLSSATVLAAIISGVAAVLAAVLPWLLRTNEQSPAAEGQQAESTRVPEIGHRSEDFRNLYREIHPKLQTLFGTKQPVFLSTSSAWGVMEASIRNVVDRQLN